jgi:hypothetical protein
MLAAVLARQIYCDLPDPQIPDAVPLNKTLSPTSWSGFVVVLFLGIPLAWPLNTVNEGIAKTFSAQNRWYLDLEIEGG